MKPGRTLWGSWVQKPLCPSLFVGNRLHPPRQMLPEVQRADSSRCYIRGGRGGTRRSSHEAWFYLKGFSELFTELKPTNVDVSILHSRGHHQIKGIRGCSFGDCLKDFPGGPVVKNLPANAGTWD